MCAVLGLLLLMATVGLLINETKPTAVEEARRLTTALEGRGVRLLAREALSRQMPDQTVCCPATDEEIAASDFVVVFGGDGTLLATARFLAPYGTPILGVHLGHFGFITEVDPKDLLRAVEDVLAGRCAIEERMMLSGILHRARPADGQKSEEALIAMNDIVVASGAVRMVHVNTRIDADELATYAADGVIVSSPTGSTGYSLSAGGPLVHPNSPVLVITPISPHTLNARTLIIPDTETVTLTVEGRTRDSVVVSVDGQIDLSLGPGDTVRVSRAPHNVRLLSAGGPNFYQKIRSRWHYGEREPW